MDYSDTFKNGVFFQSTKTRTFFMPNKSLIRLVLKESLQVEKCTQSGFGSSFYEKVPWGEARNDAIFLISHERGRIFLTFITVPTNKLKK